MTIAVFPLMLLGLALSSGQVPSGTVMAGLDTERIERLTGATGKLDEKEGVFKVSVPRSDLSVRAAGVKITPPMGLTSWAAFKPAGDHAMVMGDMVLLEDQVDKVMSAALDNGLEVTALHNHFFWESPRVMFMHIGGMGPEENLASAVGAVLARIRETSSEKVERPVVDIDPARSRLDIRKIEGNDHALARRNFSVAHASAPATSRSRSIEPRSNFWFRSSFNAPRSSKALSACAIATCCGKTSALRPSSSD